MSLLTGVGFLVAFFFQLLTGFVLTPLFFFLQLTSTPQTQNFSELEELASALYWGFLTGVSVGIMTASALAWIIIMLFDGLLIVGIKKYIFASLTPITISFLLLCFIGIWFIMLGAMTFSMFAQLYIIYAFSYFFLYALVWPQKNYQTRLF